MTAEAGVAVPVPAATILLLRGDHATLEVFMIVRHEKSDFLGGALVFPGGKVDPQDADERLLDRCTGADADATRRALQVAAIREAFEECGVLLARPSGSTSLIDAAALASLEPYRKALVDGSIGLYDFVVRERLVLACDRLTPFAHWITPTMVPKRFDTHFFVAEAPVDHLALHDGHESVDSVWITPAAAIEAAKARRYTVIFPTVRNLEKLAHAKSPADARRLAAASTIVSVTPWNERRADGNYLCIPKDAGYAVTEEKMPERAAR